MKQFCFSIFFCLSAFSLCAQWSAITNHNAPGGIGVVWAVNANTVFAMSGDILLKTSNGGQTWQQQNLHPQPFTYNPEAIHFFDTQNGMIVGSVFGVQPLTYTTHDGGQTWTAASISTPDIIQVEAVQMVSPTVAYCLGWYGYAFKTTDGGLSWNQISIPNASEHWNDIDFSDPMHGKVLNQSGFFYFTNDGGQSWNEYFAPVESQGAHMQFFDASNGYLNDPGVGFYSTSNGGQTWALVANVDLGAFYFTSPLTGWAVTPGGISRTKDGGQTWSLQTNTTAQIYGGMHFSGGVGWVVGTDANGKGVMYKAANNGGFGISLDTGPTEICSFQTATITCMHDGATAFDWLVDGVSQGVNNPVFHYSPGQDGQFEITCVASKGAQSVRTSFYLYAYSLPYQPFNTWYENTVCIGEPASIQYGLLKAGLQYRIQQGSTILKEWTPDQDGYEYWQTGPLTSAATIDFYGFYPACGWQILHSATINVTPVPETNLPVILSKSIYCENEPVTLKITGSEPFVSYQAFVGNDPWSPIVQGGAAPLTLTANGFHQDDNLLILASSSPGCRRYLNDMPFVDVIEIEPSFTLSSSLVEFREAVIVENTSADSLAFSWSFSGAAPDIQGSTLKHPPPIHFGAEGTGVVALIGTSPTGCKDTLIKEINVYNGAAIGTTWTMTHDLNEQKTLEVDSAGNVYAYTDWYAKTISSRIGGDLIAHGFSNVFYKHNKFGVLQWSVTIDDNDGIPAGVGIVDQYTDKSGNDWLLVNMFHSPGLEVEFSSTDGRTITTAKNSGMAIVHYSPSGLLKSVRFIESVDPTPDPLADYAQGIALRRDESGDFFVLGSILSSNDQINQLQLILSDLNGALDTIEFPNNTLGPNYLLKFSADGQFYWLKNVSDYFTAAGYSLPFDPLMLETDHAGGCYIWSKGGPHPPQTQSSLGVQIARYDENGARVWKFDRTIFSGYYTWANDMAVDNDGNVYILGSVYGCCSFSDFGSGPYFAKIGRDGAIKFVRTIVHYNHGSGNLDERALGIAIDEDNKVYALTAFDYIGDHRAYIDPLCVDTTLTGPYSMPMLTAWDSLGNLLQIIPSNAYINFPNSINRVSRHLRARNGIIYALGNFQYETGANFLGVPFEQPWPSYRSFLARVPDPKNYVPYLNTCDFKVCEIDSTSKLQISYLFDQVQWYCNDTLLNGYTQAAITPPKSGVYRATAVNPLGIERTTPVASTVKIAPFPFADIMEKDSGLIATFYPGIVYFWYDSLGTFVASTYEHEVFYPKSPGWYSVQVNGLGLCNYTSPLFYFDGIVGVHELQGWLTRLSIAPNPNTGTFSVQISTPVVSGGSLRIVDLAGKPVFIQPIVTDNAVQQLVAADLPAGMYLLQLVVSERVLAVEKFVKL